MKSEYIVDPSDSMAVSCSENGLFLEDDYYMAMSHNEISENYWKRIGNIEKTNRKIAIVGAYETPMTITKSAFLALTLAKPEKLTIKVSGKDESMLLKQMYEQNKQHHECEFAVYQSKTEELASSVAWLRDVEEATDVTVFGGLDTLSFFNMKSEDNQNVYLHKPKFSFGIASRECLDDEENLMGLVGDFLSYFGEGTLAPKFYVTLGKLSNDQMNFITDCIMKEEDLIKEFRAKLPLSKKTLLLHDKTVNNFISPHVKKSTFENIEFLSPLFGDIRLIEARHESDIENFVNEYNKVISSIALEEETMGDLAAGMEIDIPRYCDIGSLQFPHFYEPYDEIDELDIFNNDIEIY